jgi:predicted Zn-dependent protease with MMP-like domain
MKYRPKERLARETIAALLAEMPAELRARAEEVPVVFFPRPTEEMLDEGLEEDLLGLFVGENRMEEDPEAMPPEILLFLDNLWDYAEGDREAFEEEVRVTYYHELGHYLGLEEDDLFDRGLE